jgi:Ca-activated chloride channel family protein
LNVPLNAEHGVDTAQPQTILEIPSAAVITGIEALWRENKKPVDLVVVMDISGSMRGDKITSARSSLMQFITKLDNSDRLQIDLFNDQITTLTQLTPIGDKRRQVLDSVSGIFEQNNTSLYDAVLNAYDSLQTEGDPNHIRAIVVLSDGADTASAATLDDVIQKIQLSENEGGNAIKVFTIAFGEDADADILKRIAEPSGGKQYDSLPETIQKIYDEIATFF